MPPSQEYETELNFLNVTPWPNIEILPLFFKKVKGFGGPQGQEDGGGNAFSYEGVAVINKYMKMKLSLSILFFLVSVKFQPRWQGQEVGV